MNRNNEKQMPQNPKLQSENVHAERKRIKKSWIIYIGIALITALLNVIAWNSTAFCDAYITYVFPIWVNTFGRLTGLFPFSVGEWLIVAGGLLVLLAVLLGVVCIAVGLVKAICGVTQRGKRLRFAATEESMPADKGREQGILLLWKITGKFYRFFAWTLLAVCVIMTLNCSILYHASMFSENYFGEETGEYTLEEFINVYNHVAAECNRLSLEVARDAEGRIVYTGDPGDTEGTAAKTSGTSTAVQPGENAWRNHMADEAIASMQRLGATYSQLDGWYPRPKPMAFSDFMCQQYMCGYYFPFSMEANYNDVMYIMNKPSAMCHELAHLRGYIFEDEANFIAYLACLESEDPLFQYAGYLSVITYLENDLYKAYRDEKELFTEIAVKTGLVRLSDQVYTDNIFVEQSEWDRINDKAVMDTETVEEVSDTFTDTTLKLNGVSDGIVSYSRVVRLLLQYYAHISGQ